MTKHPIRDILLSTYSILRQEGVWVQLSKSQTTPMAPDCQCLMTALNKSIEDLIPLSLEGDARSIVVLKLIEQIPPGQILKPYDQFSRETPRVLIDWNDTPGRTREEVLALIQRTYDAETPASSWNAEANLKSPYDPQLLALIAKAIEKGSVGAGHPSPYGLFDYSNYGVSKMPHHVRDFREGSATQGQTVFQTNDAIEARLEYDRLSHEHQATMVMRTVMEWMNKKAAAHV